MKKEFLEAYQRELSLLKERAAAFAYEHPGLADRLGGLLEENLDPSIGGLLEGAAFLAARVQLNIDQQFRTFTSELLNQLSPDLTSPIPSAMLVCADPPGNPADLAEGKKIEVGEYIEAAFKEASRRVTVRYRLSEPLTFWPLELKNAVYHGEAKTMSNLVSEESLSVRDEQLPKTVSGLALSLKRTDGAPIGDLAADALPVHFVGPITEANALYEQVFSNLKRVSLRWSDKNGDPVSRRYPIEHLEQVGFDPDTPLFGRDERLFPGFSWLVEYFAFPRKFLGLRLTRLKEHLRGIPADEVNVVFEFSTAQPRLAAQFEPEHVRLFCAPAVNLFEDNAKPISLDARRHSYPVTPNRTPITNYEVQRVLEVRAQYAAQQQTVEVWPLYALPGEAMDPRQALYFTTELQRRRLSQKERLLGGTRHRYEGTEASILVYEPPQGDPASILFIKTLCSNRHLPEILPFAEASFELVDDRKVKMKCIAGPTSPREAVAELEADGPHRMKSGDNYWRLISILSLSQRGFIGPNGTGNVAALREMLTLFSDVSDNVSSRQIQALHSISTRQITRTVRRPSGFHAASGIQVTLEFDDDVLDPGSLVAFTAMLDRFLADYAAVNSFTQCVVRSRKDRVIKSWPPRSGSGPLL